MIPAFSVIGHWFATTTVCLW